MPRGYAGMAYALVECKQEGSITVIPSSWIVKPDRIQGDVDFPMKGVCYWKRKGNKFDIYIYIYIYIYLYIYCRKLIWKQDVFETSNNEIKYL